MLVECGGDVESPRLLAMQKYLISVRDDQTLIR